MTTALQEPARLGQDETFDRLSRLAAKAVQSSAAFVTLADRDTDEIVFAGIMGVPEIPTGERRALSQTICRHVVFSGTPLVVADTQTHPLARDEAMIQELGIGAYLGVPLATAEGEIVGVLGTVERHPREWTSAHIEITEGLAAAVMTEIGLRTTIAAAALQAEERHAIVESALDCIVAMDAEGIVSEFNPAAERTFGYRREDAIGRRLSDLIIPPESREQHNQGLRHHVETGEVTVLGQRLRLTAMRSDGSRFPVELTSARIDGDPPSFVGFIRDITEQKQLEDQLRQSQKMEAVGQLAGGIAHDFNNMLTAISGYAELLASSFDASDPRAEDIEQVRKAAARGSALTRQLLTFSRKQVLLPQVLDVNEVVRGLESMLERTLGADVELATSLAEKLAPVETDADQLAQVVLNFALNGRDAMPTGGCLTITTSNVELDSRPFVSVEVSDTGIGMEEDVRNRVFEPFFTTKDVDKGTGLGLATAYGFVSQSGGRMEVDSVPGEGSTFRVLLPVLVQVPS